MTRHNRDELPELEPATMDDAIYVNNGRACIPNLWIDEKMLKWLIAQGGDVRGTIAAFLEMVLPALSAERKEII